MDDEPLIQLVERLQTRCLARNLTVATAESCTGGLLAKLITDVAGSSGYFRGGIVSYANEAKVRLLGVPEEQLAAHGAVSAQVARSMALGARDRTGADLAVAVTGVSGPGGGSPAKPVGLTYVAVADAIGTDVRRFVWAGDRAANREASARAAVELLLERISAGVASVADAAGEQVPHETPKAQQTAAPGEVAEAAESGRA
jgi:PncC family amidohydrolase